MEHIMYLRHGMTVNYLIPSHLSLNMLVYFNYLAYDHLCGKFSHLKYKLIKRKTFSFWWSLALVIWHEWKKILFFFLICASHHASYYLPISQWCNSGFDICRLQQWLKRKILDAPSEGDAGPTEAITCPHEQLRPDQATGAKRVLVPENLWLFLYEDAIAVKPDDLSGCSAFPSDSKQCSQCSDDLSEEAVKEDSLRWFQHI